MSVFCSNQLILTAPGIPLRNFMERKPAWSVDTATSANLTITADDDTVENCPIRHAVFLTSFHIVPCRIFTPFARF